MWKWISNVTEAFTEEEMQTAKEQNKRCPCNSQEAVNEHGSHVQEPLPLPAGGCVP
jgi:hypothetical protein